MLAEYLKPIFPKIDFSNVSFNNVDVSGVDFTGSKGAQINPQTISYSCMCRCVFTDVTFVGSFDQVSLNEVNFLGSRGAKIDFSKLDWNLFNHHLEKTNLTSVEIVGKLKNRKIKALYHQKNKKLSLKSK